MRILGEKVRTTLTIDDEVLKTGMKIGMNVSQFCENALREAIEKLKSPKTITNGGTPFLGEASFSKEGSVDRAGFEPATSALRMRRSYQTELPALVVSF